MTDPAAPSGPIDELMPASPTPRRRRTALAAAGAVGVAAVVGGGVWVTQSFLARGPQPAEALPASTLGYAAVDLDPSGSQKIEAAKFLGSFPSLSKGKSSGDLRERFFNLMMQDSDCDLKFSEIEPWVGNRVAAAVVGYDRPEPVVVLEVDDAPGLEKGLDRAEKCADGHAGHAVRGDWAVLARTDAVAKSVLDDGAEAPLSADADFKKWTGKAGDPGIVTLYAAPAAGDAILKAAEQEPEVAAMGAAGLGSLDPAGVVFGMAPLFSMGMMFTPGMEEEMASDEAMPEFEPLTKEEERRLAEMTPEEQQKFVEKRFPAPEKVGGGSGGPGVRLAGSAVRLEGDRGPSIPEEVRAALHGFKGAGGTLRFNDGALEFEMVADHLPGGVTGIIDGTGANELLAQLPTDVPMAYAGDLAEDWTDRILELVDGFGVDEDSTQSIIKEFEKETGLDFPSDVEALGGDSVAFAVDGTFKGTGADDAALPPIAARVHGDAGLVEAALAKLKDHAATKLVWRRDGGDVLVGVDKSVLDRLAGGSGLTSSRAYKSVVPDSDAAASVLFIDFDANNWIEKSVSKRDRADVKPLEALGFSRTVKDGEDHTLIRLTTD